MLRLMRQLNIFKTSSSRNRYLKKDKIMKTRISNIRIIGIIVFALITHISFSQKSINISGRIINAENKEPLSYVNISLQDKNIGTISNKEGYFIFKCPEEYEDNTLIISCIGYESYTKKLAAFSNSMNIIELKPATIILDEVVVREKTALGIIKEALQKMPENYDIVPYIMTGFYRETIMENKNYIKYAEGVIDIYREIENDDLIKLIKGRTKEDNQYESSKMTIINIGGPGACLYRDLAKHKREFLNEKYFEHYEYKIKSITNYKGKSVYEIIFDRKEDDKKARHKGELYIDVNSLALIKVNYRFNDWGIKNRQPGFMTKTMFKMMKMDIEIYDTEISVNYEEVNGIWYLKNIKYYDAVLVTKKKKQFLYETQKDLLISSISKNNVGKFSKDEILSTNKEFRKQVGEYDQEFWENYNIIEVTKAQKIQMDDMKYEEIN